MGTTYEVSSHTNFGFLVTQHSLIGKDEDNDITILGVCTSSSVAIIFILIFFMHGSSPVI